MHTPSLLFSVGNVIFLLVVKFHRIMKTFLFRWFFCCYRFIVPCTFSQSGSVTVSLAYLGCCIRWELFLIIFLPAATSDRFSWYHWISCVAVCRRTWNEVWDVASKECRDEITQIDSDSLLVTVEEYLRKHRWATQKSLNFILCFLLLRFRSSHC